MNANQIIEAIKEFTTEKQSIIDVLCDGAALKSLGVSDEDQDSVEESFEIIRMQQTKPRRASTR